MVDLSMTCDACGKMVGGGVHSCPKCKIYFCFYCSTLLSDTQKNLKKECPMCGGKFE